MLQNVARDHLARARLVAVDNGKIALKKKSRSVHVKVPPPRAAPIWDMKPIKNVIHTSIAPPGNL